MDLYLSGCILCGVNTRIKRFYAQKPQRIFIAHPAEQLNNLELFLLKLCFLCDFFRKAPSTNISTGEPYGNHEYNQKNFRIQEGIRNSTNYYPKLFFFQGVFIKQDNIILHNAQHFLLAPHYIPLCVLFLLVSHCPFMHLPGPHGGCGPLHNLTQFVPSFFPRQLVVGLSTVNTDKLLSSSKNYVFQNQKRKIRCSL